MSNELQWLSTCGRPWAEQRAVLAMNIIEAHNNGEVSDSEFKELLYDLVRTDRLDSEADDLQTKTLLVNAISLISKVV